MYKDIIKLVSGDITKIPEVEVIVKYNIEKQLKESIINNR